MRGKVPILGPARTCIRFSFLGTATLIPLPGGVPIGRGGYLPGFIYEAMSQHHSYFFMKNKSHKSTIFFEMIRPIIPYNPKLKKLARELRQNMTLSEVLLWNQLKQAQMLGHDFDRQRPIDNYIVDFYCKDLRLAIEIDGASHDFEVVAENDIVRQERLEFLGVRFCDLVICRLKVIWLMSCLQFSFGLRIMVKKPTPPCGHPSKEGI